MLFSLVNWTGQDMVCVRLHTEEEEEEEEEEEGAPPGPKPN